MIYNQFYSKKNIDILKRIILEDLKKNYNLENVSIHNELQNCMKYVKENVSSSPPKNIDNDKYLALMNKKVYNLVLGIYQNKTQNIINNSLNVNNQNNNQEDRNKIESKTIQDKLFDNEIIKNYKNNDEVIDYPKPSYSSNNDVQSHTEKLKQERELIYPQVKEIKFNEDNDIDKNNNTLDLYNDLLTTYNKQVNDLEKFEVNQVNRNNNINSELNIMEEQSNIQKLTPIHSLNDTSLNNTIDKDVNSEVKMKKEVKFEKNNITNLVEPSNDEIFNFQQFLNDNKEEINKEETKLSGENLVNVKNIENNSSLFGNNNLKSNNILLKKPNYEQSTKTDYIIIDSRYRDFNLYPNQCNFVFKFSPNDNNFIFKVYKENDVLIIAEKKIVIGNQSLNDVSETFDNIKTIYLDNVIVPVHSYEFTANNIQNTSLSELSLTIYKDSYLLLEIPELRSPYKGGNTNFKKSFAVLRINHGSSLTAMTFSNNFTNLIVPNEILLYEPSPLGKLDKLTLKLNNKNSRIYNFGIDKLYIKNFSKGELKHLGICGKMEYSTKFEINRIHVEYLNICKEYYNIKECDVLTNNPLVLRDLIYFYHVVPNENELVFFEKDVKIDTFKKNVNDIKISLSYKLNNVKKNVNIQHLFASFKTVVEDLNNYYFIIIISGQKYYLRIKNIEENFIYLENYPNLPTFNKTKVMIGLSKGNKAGSNNDKLDSLFYSSGFNVISVENNEDNGSQLGSFIIEIDYPYDNLPNFIKENNFTDDDLFIIQDKKQISYGFTIKYNIKDHEELNSYLNESGHN